ncbi:hypothetical protein, partial [Faecalibaculum rodentium]
MRNENASNGMAEDLIRSFVQIASAELHTKTSIEKAVSDIENGVSDDTARIEYLKEDLMTQASLRREIMLSLYRMYG